MSMSPNASRKQGVPQSQKRDVGDEVLLDPVESF